VEDIAAMVRLGRVEHARLVERFKLAVDWFLGDARGADIPAWCANLNRVERDLLQVKETVFELPSWI
jgi:hypothetical protein